MTFVIIHALTTLALSLAFVIEVISGMVTLEVVLTLTSVPRLHHVHMVVPTLTVGIHVIAILATTWTLTIMSAWILMSVMSRHARVKHLCAPTALGLSPVHATMGISLSLIFSPVNRKHVVMINVTRCAHQTVVLPHVAVSAVTL